MDGARRLGRNAMVLSIVAILGGIAIIAAAIALNWGCEYFLPSARLPSDRVGDLMFVLAVILKH